MLCLLPLFQAVLPIFEGFPPCFATGLVVRHCIHVQVCVIELIHSAWHVSFLILAVNASTHDRVARVHIFVLIIHAGATAVITAVRYTAIVVGQVLRYMIIQPLEKASAW